MCLQQHKSSCKKNKRNQELQLFLSNHGAVRHLSPAILTAKRLPRPKLLSLADLILVPLETHKRQHLTGREDNIIRFVTFSLFMYFVCMYVCVYVCMC
jgi:hypothetical protein